MLFRSLKFNPLWSMSDAEQATVNLAKAQTALAKAQATQVYVEMQALDPSEVRAALASDEEYNVEDVATEDEDEDLMKALLGSGQPDAMNELEAAQKSAEEMKTPGGGEQSAGQVAPAQAPLFQSGDFDAYSKDAATPTGVGVLVVVDSEILCGTRAKEGTICGPGGHIEAGETPEQAAVREAQEEFGITPKELIPVTTLTGMPEQYGVSQVYLCTEFDGHIACDGVEMARPGFLSMEKAKELMTDKPERLFEPFRLSIEALLTELFPNKNSDLTAGDKQGRVNDRGDFEESKHPRDESGQFASTGSGGSSGTASEAASTSSAEGENSPCTGFAFKAKLRDHAKRHGLGVGTSSEAEYQQKGIDFLKQPCGGDVIGYARPDGAIVRFNMKTCEYAAGKPGGSLSTYMSPRCDEKTGEARPDKAMDYYTRRKAKDSQEG